MKIGRSKGDEMRKIWTTKEVEKLRELARDHTVRQIAKILGVTKEQAGHKLHAEGIRAVKSIKINNNDQPCWECKWATGLEGKCIWAKETTTLPEGCVGKKVINSSGETYKIIYCPLFVEG